MDQVRPIYKQLLIVALVVYIIATAIMLSDLYVKVGEIYHTLLHLTGKH